MKDNGSLTAAASRFVAQLEFDSLPNEAVRIGRRCVLDGLAVALGGSEQPITDVVESYVRSIGGVPQSRVIGNAELRLPAHLAAFWNGAAGHAMDWDDTQLAEGPGRPYGLLTHPTMPPLAAGLAIADMLGNVSGRDFLTAFLAGFEVECKIAEAINPDHYNFGFHTSGTVGTFGAAACASRLLGLDESGIAQAIGLAASMAAGIRANFGTMGKPMHVGRSAENGVTAALLVRYGFTANESALDGQWGYLAVAGRGGEPELVIDRFGDPHTIVSPGVSIKPYPSGVLTHPSMDAMKKLMRDHDLSADDIERATLFAANNILHPIRFEFARSELEGKFCMAFLLAAIVVAGQAGKAEFTDEFVLRDDVQAMQRRIGTAYDPQVDALGHDRIRSRLEVWTKDGRHLVQWADEDYRGGPHNPLSDEELQDKFSDCASGLLDQHAQQTVFDFAWSLEKQMCATDVLKLLSWRNQGSNT